MVRKNTRTVNIGNVSIGGGNPIALQSMTNTLTSDVESTVAQIKKLEEAGADIIRCAVSSEEDAKAIGAIKERIRIPFVADIQFNYKLALSSIENGADKIRINPGNIGTPSQVKFIANLAKERGVPIRVGVNSGSLEKPLLEKYGRVCAEALVESALSQASILEDSDFNDIVISIKTTDVAECIDAHIMLADKCDYPLHIGITESGTVLNGSIRSAVGIGAILSQGIGDTIRVSLTGDPVNEITTGLTILKSLGLRKGGVEVYSCPTCGRTKIDLESIANEVEKRCASIDLPLKVAIMGCAVNGPGEAKEADIGIAGGDGEGLLFKKGEIIKKIPESELVDALTEELNKWD